jgi:hypothetical protein
MAMIGDWTIEESALDGYASATREQMVVVDDDGLTMSVLTGPGTLSNASAGTVEVAFVRNGVYENPEDFPPDSDDADEVYAYVPYQVVVDWLTAHDLPLDGLTQ